MNYLISVADSISSTSLSMHTAIHESLFGSTSQRPMSIEDLPQLGNYFYPSNTVTANFVRLAGLSGVLTVALGAYGAHAFEPEDPNKNLFMTANRYHSLHTLALLATPLTRRPLLTGLVLIVGMGMFSGSLYYRALTNSDNEVVRKITPYGGIVLILAWATMML